MIKKFSILLTSILVFSFLQMDCKDDPPVISPTPSEDTLIVFEQILSDGGQPAVSPDGKMIAYTFNGDIWIMDTSGLNKSQITSGTNVDILPRWNPDGIKIGFVKISSENAPVGKISTVTSSGGAVIDIPLTDNFSNTLRLRSEIHGIGAYPIWDFSPDGQNVAFHSLENDSVYIYVVNVAAGETRMRQSIGKYNSDDSPCLAWSLTPNEIAFIVQELDSNNFRRSRAVKREYTNNVTIRDSSVFWAGGITRSPMSNTFMYYTHNSGNVYFTVTDFIGKYEIINIPPSKSHKISQDETMLLYYSLGEVFGPFGYKYSQIGIHDIAKKKSFLLIKQGDVNRYNYYFEWSKKPNEVFFERYGKIVKAAFTLP